MSPQEISAWWRSQEEKVTLFPREKLAGYGLREETLAFLSTVGLPADASPYLSFAEAAAIQPVGRGYGIGPEFDHYLRIGSDGAGNPLVLNVRERDVVQWLNHEDGFVAYYVNESVAALVACLVRYGQFVADLLATRGPDAYLEADFTDEQLASLQAAITALDGRAATQPGFWQDELTTLLANREHYHRPPTP